MLNVVLIDMVARSVQELVGDHLEPFKNEVLCNFDTKLQTTNNTKPWPDSLTSARPPSSFCKMGCRALERGGGLGQQAVLQHRALCQPKELCQASNGRSALPRTSASVSSLATRPTLAGPMPLIQSI